MAAFLWWVQHEAATYLSRAQTVAYQIGVKPDEFWAMTPAELMGMAMGFRHREEQAWRRAALIVQHMYVVIGAKRVPTFEKLVEFKSGD